MKDIFAGEILEPDEDTRLKRCTDDAFEYFVDDNFGAFSTFKSQHDFLHNHYFLRLAWAKLTLQGHKCGFFLNKISPPGYARDGIGLRSSLNKAGTIQDYPWPTTVNEVDAFVYMTIYLHQFIPGHVQHARILKEAIVYRQLPGDKNSKSEQAGRRGKPIKVAIGIN